MKKSNRLRLEISILAYMVNEGGKAPLLKPHYFSTTLTREIFRALTTDHQINITRPWTTAETKVVNMIFGNDPYKCCGQGDFSQSVKQLRSLQ